MASSTISARLVPYDKLIKTNRLS